MRRPPNTPLVYPKVPTRQAVLQVLQEIMQAQLLRWGLLNRVHMKSAWRQVWNADYDQYHSKALSPSTLIWTARGQAYLIKLNVAIHDAKAMVKLDYHLHSHDGQRHDVSHGWFALQDQNLVEDFTHSIWRCVADWRHREWAHRWADRIAVCQIAARRYEARERRKPNVDELFAADEFDTHC
jgi:hypothetical protein